MNIELQPQIKTDLKLCLAKDVDGKYHPSYHDITNKNVALPAGLEIERMIFDGTEMPKRIVSLVFAVEKLKKILHNLNEINSIPKFAQNTVLEMCYISYYAIFFPEKENKEFSPQLEEFVKKKYPEEYKLHQALCDRRQSIAHADLNHRFNQSKFMLFNDNGNKIPAFFRVDQVIDANDVSLLKQMCELLIEKGDGKCKLLVNNHIKQ